MEILFQNAAVLDAETEGAIRDVLVEDDTIRAVGQGLAAPGAVVLDCRGKTLMPGFIDSHVHMACFGLPEERAARAFAQNGVIAVRDLGILGRLELEPHMAWLRAHQAPEFTEIVTAGRYIDVAGGYGMGPEPDMAWGLEVTDPQSAASWVEYQADAGVHGIKIGLQDWFSDAPKLSPACIRAITEAARRRGLWSTAHIGNTADLQTVAECGIGSAAHTPRDRAMDDGLIDLMVERGIPMTTTVGDPVKAAAAEHIPPMYESRQAYYEAELRARDVMLENLRRFHEAGGTILLGTDRMHMKVPEIEAAIPVGELRCLREIGMSLRQVLAAGTVNNALACHIPDCGLIREGMRASLILFPGELDEGFEKLNRPPFVMNQGIILKDDFEDVQWCNY